MAGPPVDPNLPPVDVVGTPPAPAAPEPVAASTVATPPVPAAPEPIVAAVPEVLKPEVKAETKPDAPHPSEVPSLLDKIDPPKPDAKVEAKVDAKPEAKVETPPVEVAAPEKTEWEFKLPETLKADEKQLTTFRGILDDIVAPKEGESRATYAQRLVDLHNEAMTGFAEQTLKNQISAFNDTRAEWRKQTMADERIGGAGHDTAMRAIARVRDYLVSDARPGTKEYQDDVKALNDFNRITGAGDHPVFLRMLHRAARYVDEPSAPAPNALPTKFNGRPPNAGRDLYGKSPSAAR